MTRDGHEDRLLLQTLHRALDAAGDVVMRYFRRSFETEIKADQSPVTQADREAEASIRTVIREAFPDHGILGEEHGTTEGVGGTWIVDPIDGTKSFMLGNPLFGCLVGFYRDRRVALGGLALPALNEKWIGADGVTRLNGTGCRVNTNRSLADAALLSSSPDFFSAKERKAFDALSRAVRYRRFGGDCYVYASVAAGWADLAVEADLKPFDYLPLVPIVEGAGGIMTDWQGRALDLNSSGRVIAASTPELHHQALQYLRDMDQQ